MPLVLASVFAGAVLQRNSGIGFAIVVAPFVILSVGPAQGITLVQLFGASSALLVLFRVLRDTDWRAFGFLVPTSLIGVAVGARVALDPGTWPVLSPGEWIASVCFLVAGIAVGDLVSRRVPVRAAALITWGLALCGAVITLVDALLSMS